jgi:hypothetical protein
LQLGVKRI